MFTITFTLTPIVDFYQSMVTPYQFVRYSDILHFDTTDTIRYTSHYVSINYLRHFDSTA